MINSIGKISIYSLQKALSRQVGLWWWKIMTHHLFMMSKKQAAHPLKGRAAHSEHRSTLIKMDLPKILEGYFMAQIVREGTCVFFTEFNLFHWNLKGILNIPLMIHNMYMFLKLIGRSVRECFYNKTNNFNRIWQHNKEFLMNNSASHPQTPITRLVISSANFTQLSP